MLRNERGRWLQLASYAVEEGDLRIRAEPFDAIELEFSGLFRV